MEEGHFRPPWGSITPEMIHLKLSCLITSTVRPDTQNMVAAENAEWDGHGWSCTLPCFFSLFWLLQRVHSLHWNFRSMHTKTCFGGGSVPLVSVCPVVKSSFFTPPKRNIFQLADYRGLRYYFSWELIGNVPLLNDSSVKVAYWIGNMGMKKKQMCN